MATLVDDTPCLDPADVRRACEGQGLPLDWWGQANQFKVPLGQEPGSGRVLLSRTALSALDLTADHTLTFADADGNSTALQKITVLRARCLTPGADDDPAAVMLCDLVDRRHFLAKAPTTGAGKAYNVRSADGSGYLAASCKDGISVPWTWALMFTDLWTMLGAGAAPALPFTPNGTPENLIYWGWFAWPAVCNLLDRLACAAKYDPVEDAFTVVRLGDTASTGSAAAGSEMDAQTRLWDGQFVEPARGTLPASVRVLFPRRPQPQDGSPIYYQVDTALTATPGVAAGTFEILHDDLTADGTGTPTNTAALASRAAERAADWRRKRLGYEARLAVVYQDYAADLPAVLSEVVGAVGLDDRGGPMGTVAHAGPDGRLEGFRAYEQPFVLGGAPSVVTTKPPYPTAGGSGWSAVSMANGSGPSGLNLGAGTYWVQAVVNFNFFTTGYTGASPGWSGLIYAGFGFTSGSGAPATVFNAQQSGLQVQLNTAAASAGQRVYGSLTLSGVLTAPGGVTPYAGVFWQPDNINVPGSTSLSVLQFWAMPVNA